MSIISSHHTHIFLNYCVRCVLEFKILKVFGAVATVVGTYENLSQDNKGPFTEAMAASLPILCVASITPEPLDHVGRGQYSLWMLSHSRAGHPQPREFLDSPYAQELRGWV